MTQTVAQAGAALEHEEAGDDPSDVPALWSAWRWPAATAAIIAAGAHLPVLGEHVREAPYMGVLFAVFSLGVLGLAAALLYADTVRRYMLLAGWSLLAVGTYAASRTVAFPRLERDVGNWSDPWGLLALTAELTVAGCCAAAIRRRWVSRLDALSIQAV